MLDQLDQKELAGSISDKLLQDLAKIDRPGSFCAYGSLQAVLPGLEIAGIGTIAFPLTDYQAEQIKEQCTQAPYGKGEATIIDTSVRRVWQMMPDQFELTNPQWQNFMATTLEAVEQELGLEEQELRGHLYNLLLYDKDSFFLPHKDGEKIDRMVATLVVVLPSAFQGGALVIRHEGQEQIIDFGSIENSKYLTHYAAFYADCEHEVMPLRQGYRLSLVYNLTLEKSKKSISAPRSQEHIERVTNVLRQWSMAPVNQSPPVDQSSPSDQFPQKLAIKLDHQYSQDGLAWDALKGVDRVKAQVLRHAARQAGCKAYMALLTLWEHGSVNGGGWDYYSGGRWEDEPDEDELSDYEIDEIIDSSLTAEHWLDDEGQRLAMGTLFLEEDEIIPKGSLMDVDPEQASEGPTGNAGMTIERWYRHAAIVLWPERNHFQVLCDCGTETAISALNILLHKWQSANSAEKVALRAQCLEFAAQIITNWKAESYYRESEENLQPCKLLPALELLDDAKLIQNFLAQVVAKDVEVELSIPFLKICHKQGWSAFQKEFTAIFQSCEVGFFNRNTRLLEQFCSEELPRNREWLELCDLLVEKVLFSLCAIDKDKKDWQEPSESQRSSILARLVRSFIMAEQHEGLSQLVNYTLAMPKQYTLTPVLVQTLISLKDWLPAHIKQPCITALSQWITACSTHLKELTAQIPQEPADFCRPVTVTCKCADCKELINFLKDPNEKVHRFRMRQNRRYHLEQIIKNDKCDLDHETDRTGSPQTLVCTKNTDSFQCRLKKYYEDKKHLAVLQSIDLAC